MAEREFYRLELAIGVRGDDQAKGKVRAFQRACESAEKTGQRLNLMRIAPVFVDRISPTLKAVESRFLRLANTLTKPLVLLGGAAGLTAAIGFPLKLAGEMEQARIAMDFFTGSTKAGQQALQDLMAFAAKTPFEFPFVRDVAVGLMPIYKQMYGADKAVKKTMETIRAFGDAAGYTGASMERIKFAMLGFKQISTTGALHMEELRQITENLIVPMDIFAKELGLSGKQMRDTGKAGIPAGKAMEAIVRALEKHYGGGLEKMSQSLIGLTSTVKDTARFTVMAFGMGMADPIKRILKDIVRTTDYTSEKFKAFVKRLEGAGKDVGRAFERMYWRSKEMIGKIVRSDEWQRADWGQRVSLLLDAVIRAGVPKAGEAGAKIGVAFAQGVLSGILEMANKNPLVAAAATYILTPGPPAVKGAAALTVGGIGGLMKAGEKASPYIYGTEAYVERQMEPWRALEKAAAKNQPLVKGGELRAARHASGGIFTRPHLGLVAEAGPEAVIPLRPSPRAVALWQEAGRHIGVGGVVVNVSGVTVNVGANIDEAVEPIGREIVRRVKAALQNR